jgi:hypothetical protein
MDSDTGELDLIAQPMPRRPGGSIRTPLENPEVDVDAEDPLLLPRIDEPGVGADGTCRPIENPGPGEDEPPPDPA